MALRALVRLETVVLWTLTWEGVRFSHQCLASWMLVRVKWVIELSQVGEKKEVRNKGVSVIYNDDSLNISLLRKMRKGGCQ